MDRTEFFSSMESTWAELEILLASVGPGQMSLPALWDGHSGKDVVAHMAAWSEMAIGYVEASLAGVEPIWFAPGFEAGDASITDAALDAVVDALNARIRAERAEMPLSKALLELRANHERLAELAQSMGDEELFSNERFPWRHGRPLWPLIAWNDFLHFRDHLDHFRSLAGRAT